MATKSEALVRKIEQKIAARVYKTAGAARSAIQRTKLREPKKKYLLGLVEDEKWRDVPPIAGGRTEPAPAAVKLDMSSAYGKIGASHLKQEALDRCAMLLLVYAVKNKVSMQDAFSQLQAKIEGIAIDG